jgi:hypothetical protein
VKATKGFSLTARQWRAVETYHDDLVAAMDGGVTPRARQLVDRRFSLTNLTPEKIDRMVRRYSERFLTYRAEMIARTESIRALNTGNWLALHYAAEEGLVKRGDLVRRWFPAADNATGGGACPVCLDVAMRNEQGVAFDEPFVVGANGDTIMQPPLHPLCRCVVWTRPRLFAGETFTLPRAYLPPALRVPMPSRSAA